MWHSRFAVFLSGTKSCNLRSTIPIFDPSIQRSNPWCSSGSFLYEKTHPCKYSWTQGRNYWKKGYPDQYYMYPTFVFFDTLYKANDSNSYIWCCLGKKRIYTVCIAFQQWWKLRHERIWMSVRMCYWKDPWFSQTWKKVFTHPRAKNTLGHVGKGGRPGEHHQNLWNFVLLWFIYFWRPCQKHESFKQISYIPTCWKLTSEIWKLKHPHPNDNIQSITMHLKQNIPLSSVCFFQCCQRLYMRKPGGKESTPRGNRGNPPLSTRPGWDRRKGSKIQTKTMAYCKSYQENLKFWQANHWKISVFSWKDCRDLERNLHTCIYCTWI